MRPRTVTSLKTAGHFLLFPRLKSLTANYSSSASPPSRLDALYEAFKRDPEGVSKWPQEKFSSYLSLAKVKKVSTVAEIQSEIKQAIKNHTLVRAVGSKHTVSAGIYSDEGRGVNIELCDELRKFEILEEGRDEKGKNFSYVRVGAGCHVGVDPKDPKSRLTNSLCYQLTKANYALPIIGGITHQTVAGFMQTGSAGGSVPFGIGDCIESFKFVNGKGEEIEAKRGDDIFYAAGISMGLMGIITEVVFKVREVYAVEGSEEIRPETSSWLTKDKFGKYPFEDIISKNNYAHINWFPQEGVNSVIQWKGNQVRYDPCEQPIPYENTLNKWWASAAAADIFKITDKIRCKPVITEFDLRIVARLFNIFVPPGEAVPFKDIWYKTLATEDQAPVDSFINTLFTEIWFPLDKTTDVIDRLKSLYTNPRVALGNYAMEMYGAHQSPFWLSPAYEQNVVRIDPLWWAYNEGNPAEFFKNFWDLLLGIDGARMHWGKYTPEFQLDDLKKRYPKLETWLKIREEMDPHQLFVTDYWRKRFTIPQPHLVLQKEEHNRPRNFCR